MFCVLNNMPVRNSLEDVQYLKIPPKRNYPETVVFLNCHIFKLCSSNVTIATIQTYKLKTKQSSRCLRLIKLWLRVWASSVHFWHINPFRVNSVIRNFRLWTCSPTRGAEDSLITRVKEISQEQSDSSRHLIKRKMISCEFSCLSSVLRQSAPLLTHCPLLHLNHLLFKPPFFPTCNSKPAAPL